ncbi:hypothetical protein KBD13_01285 [Patescibacteria group bacterium]|nr:hypothetical protein [Patescibacteria group bacterium]
MKTLAENSKSSEATPVVDLTALVSTLTMAAAIAWLKGWLRRLEELRSAWEKFPGGRLLTRADAKLLPSPKQVVDLFTAEGRLVFNCASAETSHAGDLKAALQGMAKALTQAHAPSPLLTYGEALRHVFLVRGGVLARAFETLLCEYLIERTLRPAVRGALEALERADLKPDGDTPSLQGLYQVAYAERWLRDNSPEIIAHRRTVHDFNSRRANLVTKLWLGGVLTKDRRNATSLGVPDTFVPVLGMGRARERAELEATVRLASETLTQCEQKLPELIAAVKQARKAEWQDRLKAARSSLTAVVAKEIVDHVSAFLDANDTPYLGILKDLRIDLGHALILVHEYNQRSPHASNVQRILERMVGGQKMEPREIRYALVGLQYCAEEAVTKLRDTQSIGDDSGLSALFEELSAPDESAAEAPIEACATPAVSARSLGESAFRAIIKSLNAEYAGGYPKLPEGTGDRITVISPSPDQPNAPWILKVTGAFDLGGQTVAVGDYPFYLKAIQPKEKKSRRHDKSEDTGGKKTANKGAAQSSKSNGKPSKAERNAARYGGTLAQQLAAAVDPAALLPGPAPQTTTGGGTDTGTELPN